MIISLSGSQGQGKSTVLNTLESLGHSVVVRKTSRSILAELGLTLDQVNKYPPLTKVFQEWVIKRHFESMEPLMGDDKFHFIERSFADIFIYNIMALGSFNEYNEWTEDYWKRCVANQSKFHKIIYLTGRTYVPEDDGVRSTSRFFGGVVDREIKLCLETMDKEIGKHQLITIDTPDNDERVAQILTAIGA